MTFLKGLIRSKLVWTIVIIGVLVGGYLTFFRSKPTYQFVPVTRGPISEVVSITGNTIPIENVDLGFQMTGTVATVAKKLGDRVWAGETIATLNTASLTAALAQAEAALSAALASRSSTSLAEASTQAQNSYFSAYTTLDSTLRNQVDLFFGSPTAYGPQLLINAPMYSFGELSTGRSKLTDEMAIYRGTLANATEQDPLTLLDKATKVAQDISSFLDKLAVAANDTNSSATAAELTALATARSSVATLLATLSTARNTYRSASVGATGLADAQVEEARAAVAVAEANLANATLVAPISGVITKQDIKVGELAAAGTPLVSILSKAGFEIDADVFEADIGKVAVGQKAAITLDAFPNESFTGRVFYIASAETNAQGVVSYLAKLSFDVPDPRLKSGLTANIDIETNHKDSVLFLPQYAILQNDKGSFVETLENGVIVDHPVMLGIQDPEGNVEILSGVAEGEQVVKVGLKAQ